MNYTAHQLGLLAVWSEANRRFAEFSKESDAFRELSGRLPMTAVEREELRDMVMTRSSWLYWSFSESRADPTFCASEQAEVEQLAEIAVAAVCRLGGRCHDDFMSAAEQCCTLFAHEATDPTIRNLLELLQQCIEDAW